MITIEKCGKIVRAVVAFTTPWFNLQKWTFEVSAASDLEAEYVAHSMREQMNEKLRRIRAEAYEEGWKDAKAKRAKRKYHHGGWPT